jgi:hypothetical protein
MNPAQLPEGILDPQQPWYPTANMKEALWSRLKAKLTGGEDVSGTTHASFVNLTNAEADRLIENIKKYGKYPQFNQVGGAAEYENLETYQKWLVEEFLEKPFRQQVDEKIDARTENVLGRVFPRAEEEVKGAETKSEVAAIIEDKVEILEAIKEKIVPPRSEYQIADPWEGSYTAKKPTTPQATLKKTKKKGRPKGSGKKKDPKIFETRIPPTSKKKMLLGMVGSGLKNVGKSLFSGGGGGGSSGGGGGGGGGTYTPTAAGEGPSMLGFAKWVTGKVTKAFKDAKTEKERADKAVEEGYQLTPEQSEKGYFLKKSLGYHFGGEAYDKTFGAFLESKSFKTTSKASTLSSQFNYGEHDPKAKKKSRGMINDLASGFRRVGASLDKINDSLNKQIHLTQKLVSETTRSADTLEEINTKLLGLADIEINDMINEESAAKDSGINIDGDINISTGKEESLFDKIFGIVDTVDDVLDIVNFVRGGKKRGGRLNPTQKNAPRGGSQRITGNVPGKKPGGFRMPRIPGRRRPFASGGIVAGSIPALVGEAGPEMVIRSGINSDQIGAGNQTKMSSGGVVDNPGGNILATGIGFGGIQGGEVMGFAQPLTTAMELPFKVAGAQMLGTMGSFLRSAGPFGGVFAPMFEIFATPFSKIFGIENSLIQSELFGGVQDKKTASRILGKIFSSIFKIFGISSDDSDDDDDDTTPSGASGQWGPLLDLIAGKESGGNYEALNPGTTLPGATKMTISEVAREAEKVGKSKGGTGAVGKYQQLPWYLVDRAKAAGLDPDKDLFTPANQDLIITKVNIEGEREGRRWLEGKMSDEQFMQGLSQEFSSLPNAQGEFHYSGQSSSMTPEKVKEALQKVKGNPTQAARGVVKPSTFSNQVQGVFELSGPDTGYRVPEYLTGGESVIGHGLEWLMKFSNKFVILPGVNKKYDVINNPKRAFNRYEEIGRQAGLEIAGFVDFIDSTIFGKPNRGPSNVKYGGAPRRTYRTDGSPDAAEIMRLLGGTPVKGAMLSPTNNMPIASVSSLDINRNSRGDISDESNVRMLKFLGKPVRVVDLPLIGDMLSPELTGQSIQITGLSPRQKEKMVTQLKTISHIVQSSSQTTNIIALAPQNPKIVPIASPKPAMPAAPSNSQGNATKAIELEKLRRLS